MINILELVTLARESGFDPSYLGKTQTFNRFCEALVSMFETRMKVILQEAEESHADALDNLWVVLKIGQNNAEAIGTFSSKPSWQDLGELKGIPDTVYLVDLKRLGRCETVKINHNTSMILVKAKKAEVALEEPKSTD